MCGQCCVLYAKSEESSSDGESPTCPSPTQPPVTLAPALPGVGAAVAGIFLVAHCRGRQGAAGAGGTDESCFLIRLCPETRAQVRAPRPSALDGSFPFPGCPSGRMKSLERFCLDFQLWRKEKKKKKSIYLEVPSQNSVKEITAAI